jgi:hypothetical protein
MNRPQHITAAYCFQPDSGKPHHGLSIAIAKSSELPSQATQFWLNYASRKPG